MINFLLILPATQSIPYKQFSELFYCSNRKAALINNNGILYLLHLVDDAS